MNTQTPEKFVQIEWTRRDEFIVTWRDEGDPNIYTQRVSYLTPKVRSFGKVQTVKRTKQ